MNLKKIATSIFIISTFSFVNSSCTNPGTIQAGKVFTASLSGSQEVPPTNSTALGTATLTLSSDEKTATITYNVSGLIGTKTEAHIHGPAKPSENTNVVFTLTGESTCINLNSTQLADLKSGFYYVNVHTDRFLNGEVRGQLLSK